MFREGVRIFVLMLLAIASACAPSTMEFSPLVTTPSEETVVPSVNNTQIPTAQLTRVDVSNLYGEWVVVDINYASFFAMTPEEAKAWIGKEAEIKREKISFDRFQCDNPIFSDDISKTADFFRGYKTDPHRLEISQSEIQVIQTGCDSTPFWSIVLLEDNRVIFSWDGIFFFLKKSES